MVALLALDIATTTGFAVSAPSGGDRPLTGTFRAEHDGDDLGRAFSAFELWLDDMITTHAPALLAFEAPIPRQGAHGFSAARLLLGLAAIAELVGFRRGLQVFECHIQTVRRHFVGNGRADKRDVLHRCLILGWEVKTADAADAAAIFDYARNVLRSNAVRQAARATA